MLPYTINLIRRNSLTGLERIRILTVIVDSSLFKMPAYYL